MYCSPTWCCVIISTNDWMMSVLQCDKAVHRKKSFMKSNWVKFILMTEFVEPRFRLSWVLSTVGLWAQCCDIASCWLTMTWQNVSCTYGLMYVALVIAAELFVFNCLCHSQSLLIKPPLAITVLLYNGSLLCGFNVPINGFTHNPVALWLSEHYEEMF